MTTPEKLTVTQRTNATNDLNVTVDIPPAILSKLVKDGTYIEYLDGEQVDGDGQQITKITLNAVAE